MSSGRRQAGRANRRLSGAVWGPHCLLWQGRHTAPFNKGSGGRLRRAERQHKKQQRDQLLANGPDRDDGYFALGTGVSDDSVY